MESFDGVSDGMTAGCFSFLSGCQLRVADLARCDGTSDDEFASSVRPSP
jgi:hypothetical protein